MTIEEKAKAYDEVVKKVMDYYEGKTKMYSDVEKILDLLFPKLKVPKNEKIKEDLIQWINEFPDTIWRGHYKKDVITWLEKQGNVDNASYEIAEKEKYDFVSGKYIECRKSFDEFKEDNSYWFEYVGNDTYIGRSDNILNKKFYITPRQLYCLFTQEHCPKENNVNEETNAPIGYGKYVDKCLNDAAKHFFSEGEDKYTVADLFYAGLNVDNLGLENKVNQCGEMKIKKI